MLRLLGLMALCIAPTRADERRAASVLIASNARVDGAGLVAARAVADDAAQASEDDNVAHAVAADDVTSVREVLLMARGLTVSSILANDDPQVVNREIVLRALSAAFAEPVNDVVLYYAGHGRQPDGAWCFDSESTPGIAEFVSFDDVASAWDRRDPKAGGPARLYIVMDSSYSGAWVVKARRRESFDIGVQAGAREGELSAVARDGRGVFTMAWLKANGNILDELLRQDRSWLLWSAERHNIIGTIMHAVHSKILTPLPAAVKAHKASTAPATNVPELPEAPVSLLGRAFSFLSHLLPVTILGGHFFRILDHSIGGSEMHRPRLVEVGTSYLSFFDDWMTLEAAGWGITRPFQKPDLPDPEL